MRLVVFVDEFTLRAPLHGYLQENVVIGARGMEWASECFPLEGEYTEPQSKYNGNYRRPRFVRILAEFEGLCNFPRLRSRRERKAWGVTAPGVGHLRAPQANKREAPRGKPLASASLGHGD